jgi:hypothetical protein
MASRTQTRIDKSNSLSLLTICRHGHLSFHRMIRDSRTTQADTGFTSNTFGGIHLKRLIIFLKSPSK